MANWRRKWNTWRALPTEVRRLTREAALRMAYSRLAIAAGGSGFLQRTLRESTPVLPQPDPPLARSVRTAIRLATRMLPGETLCLSQAIAARQMLSRRGFGSTLHLGVGKNAQDLHAHAWLESAGLIVTGHQGIAAVVPLPARTLLTEPS